MLISNVQWLDSQINFCLFEQTTNGKGPGVFESFNFVENDLVAILDSDLSVDPEELNHIFEIIEQGTADFVNCPKIPEIELTRINRDAVVTIIFGFSAFNKKRIGLKKIPPPIPTIPETNPRIEPIKNEINKFSFLIIIFSFS